MKGSVIFFIILATFLLIASIFYGIYYENEKDDPLFNWSGFDAELKTVSILCGVFAIIFYSVAYYLHKYS